MREREGMRKYLREIGGATGLYLVVLFFSLRYAKYLAEGFGRTLLLLAPMIPCALMLWAFMRHMKRMDEYVRLRSLQSLAVAGGITGGFALTYGFLEIAGYPRIGMFSVWMMFCLSWGVVSCAQLLYCKFATR